MKELYTKATFIQLDSQRCTHPYTDLPNDKVKYLTEMYIDMWLENTEIWPSTFMLANATPPTNPHGSVLESGCRNKKWSK